MRTLILIASVLLLSTSAQAGASRSLTLASHQEASAEQPKPAEPAKSGQQAADQPQATATESKAADKTVDARPKRRSVPTEARVIYELHRHGIYW